MNRSYKKSQLSINIYNEIKTSLDKRFEKNTAVVDDKEIAGWFMGTKGENLKEVSEIIETTLKNLIINRAEMFPDDPCYITEEVKTSEGYNRGLESVKAHSEALVKILNKYSLPTQSLRYQGHMLWDITLPSMIGYFAAMLQNQNNVTPQASPATTILELLVCNDIAQMAGFHIRPIDADPEVGSDKTAAWAHLSCDGSVANIESLWAAREVKYLPLGIQYALKNDELLKGIADRLKMPGKDMLLTEASAWELLNMKQDDILSLPGVICKLADIELPEVWTILTSSYTLNAKGLRFFEKIMDTEDIKAPCVIVPSTKHYSWPKGASLLAMGTGQKGLEFDFFNDYDKESPVAWDGLINIYVDEHGRMDTELLKKVLIHCREIKKPVIMVVGVMGTTEEGAVDPLNKILLLRKKTDLETSPFYYAVHADAAWGGYFLTCCRNPFEMEDYPEKEEVKGAKGHKELFDNSTSWFRWSVYEAMTSICRCDSVTIDPHKMGYIPYPAGSLTYRNEEIVNLLTFSAPYISSGASDNEINTRNIGQCGIEGSKSGAAAASVYLSHKVIRPNKEGYGRIINQSMLNSKIFYLYMLFIEDVFETKPQFKLVMFDKAPKNIPEGYKKTIINYLKAGNFESLKREEILREIAGDQNIIDYIFVNKTDNSIDSITKLNEAVFKKLNLEPGYPVKEDGIFVSMTTFTKADYGRNFIESLAKRVCKESSPEEIPCIRSVIMDPWAIFTTGGNNTYNFFKDVFIPKLIDSVNELC